jgi:hypothetical protein
MSRSRQAINRRMGGDDAREPHPMFEFFARLFVVSAVLAAAQSSAAAPADRPTAGPLSPEAVQVVERRLKQFADEAAKETGPEYPPSASQAAYHLLAGLVAGRPQVTNLTDDDRLLFGLSTYRQVNGVLFEINREARVASVANVIADKSGTYLIRRHTLHVLRNGRWTAAGCGEIAASAD